MITSRWRQAAALSGFGLLAAITAWWGYSPEEAPEAGGQSLANPAYSLRSAVLEETGPDGRWRLQIKTDTASESAPGSREIDLQGVHALYHPGSPDAWRLQAKEGHLPAGGHRLLLSGAVELQPVATRKTTSPRISTARLALDLEHERATTRAPVTIHFGPHALGATGLTADMKAGTLQLESALHGTFQH
jgi:LPS export ABC transporter protein LptC